MTWGDGLNCVLRNHSFHFKTTSFYLRNFACHSSTAYQGHLAPSKWNSTFQDSPVLKEPTFNPGRQSAHISLIWASFISTSVKNTSMTLGLSIWDKRGTHDSAKWWQYWWQSSYFEHEAQSWRCESYYKWTEFLCLALFTNVALAQSTYRSGCNTISECSLDRFMLREVKCQKLRGQIIYPKVDHKANCFRSRSLLLEWGNATVS